MAETITPDGEVVADESTALAVLQSPNQSLVATMLRAEIDTLVTTARTYPRSIDRAVKMLKSIVTLDATSALECIFALPRGGKPIRGASIRFAEAALASWGNAMVQAAVTHIDREEKVVIAEGSYRDLETNVMTRSSVRRRISDKHGRIFTDDLIIVTGNAACSIARRNAILAGIPKPVWRAAYEAVEATIAGNAQTLSATRESAVKAFAMYGVKPEQVFAALGVAGIEDVQLDHVITLRGMYSAIKNEEATVEEVFNMRVTATKPEGVVDPLGAGPTAPAAETAKTAAPTEKKADKAKKSKDAPAVQETGQSGEAGAAAAADPQAAAATVDKADKAPTEPTGEVQPIEAQPHGEKQEPKPTPAPAKAEAVSAAKAPGNEIEYRDHVLAYCSAATNATELGDRWKSERRLRADVNITSEVMEPLKAHVQARVNELKGAAQ
jgi:hypothetical protein